MKETQGFLKNESSGGGSNDDHVLNSWSVEDVCQRLRDGGALDMEVQTFENEGIDGSKLLTLTQEYLKDDLGMTLKVRVLVKKWKEGKI